MRMLADASTHCRSNPQIHDSYSTHQDTASQLNFLTFARKAVLRLSATMLLVTIPAV
jgi:hypothetical protein